MRDVTGIACLGIIWLAFACGSGGGSNPLVLYSASPEGHGAMLRGRLEMEDGCLYVTDEGGERWLAAFPLPGTTWNGEDRSVRVGDKVLRVGATGKFGGGETRGPSTLHWLQAPHANCDASKVWLVTTLDES